MIVFDSKVFESCFAVLKAAKKDELWFRSTEKDKMELFVPGDINSLSIKMDMQGDDTFEFGVVLSVLDNWLRSELDATIKLEKTSEKMRLKSGTATLTLPMISNAMTFPVESPLLVSLEIEDLKRILSRVEKATTKDVARIALSGVQLKSVDGVLKITATDTHRLHQETVPCTETFDILIPGETVHVLNSIIDRTLPLKIGKGTSSLSFAQDKFCLVCPLLEATYPSVNHLFNQVDPVCLELSPKDLKNKLLQVGAIAFSDNKLYPKIKLFVKDKILYMESDCQFGKSQAELAIDSTDLPDFFLNPRLLLEALECFGNDNVKLCITLPLKPIILKNEGNFSIVVMPMNPGTYQAAPAPTVAAKPQIVTAATFIK